MSIGYGSQLPPRYSAALNLTESGIGQPFANVEVWVNGACARSRRFSMSKPCSTSTSTCMSIPALLSRYGCGNTRFAKGALAQRHSTPLSLHVRPWQVVLPFDLYLYAAPRMSQQMKLYCWYMELKTGHAQYTHPQQKLRCCAEENGSTAADSNINTISTAP